MDSNRLTPLELRENPALGILVVVLEGLNMARLALCGVHADFPDDEFLPKHPDEAAAGAYAFAILSQIEALQGTIRSYHWSVKRLRRRSEETQDGEEPLDEVSLF
jgi:hypothetical protein